MKLNSKIIFLLLLLALAGYYIYSTKGEDIENLKKETTSYSHMSAPKEAIFKHSKSVFYFDAHQGSIWSVNKEKEHISITVYNPTTKKLIKKIPLPHLKNVSQHDVAKWEDNLWVVDSRNEKFALINSKDFSVITDPKQINSTYLFLPEPVFSVDRANDFSVILTFENGDQVHFNPEQNVFSKGQVKYKSIVSYSDFYYLLRADQNENNKRIIRYKNGDIVSEGETFIRPTKLHDDGEFVLLKHNETLSKNSETLLTLIDKDAKSLWTKKIPTGNTYKVLQLSSTHLILANEKRSNTTIIAYNTTTGKINWKM